MTLLVIKLPSAPFSSTPRTLQIAFIMLGPIVAPAAIPTKEPNIPSSNTSLSGTFYSFAISADSTI